jgi:formamidopyrimidine-DNA glycosylase
MPELPEVENVRRSLAGRLLGRRVVAVTLRRADVVRGEATPTALLAGAEVTALWRQGKQLALAGRRPDGSEPCLCVHLGMTGQLTWEQRDRGHKGPRDDGQPGRGRFALRERVDPHTGSSDQPRHPLDPSIPRSVGPYLADRHTHLIWHFEGGGELRFRDVRRFGGVWPFADAGALEGQRWARLGGDALTIQPRMLHRRLRATRRALKTALLDQNLVAGLGNIYVDELLFAARVDPHRPANTLSLGEVQQLVRRMRRLLHQAIAAGGSTFRDYVDAAGEAGGFQDQHRVYGRADQPCRRCRTILSSAIVAGRNTVFCKQCQA